MPTKVTHGTLSLITTTTDILLATLAEKDQNVGKKKFVQFENEAGRERTRSGSEATIVNNDSLQPEKEPSQDGKETETPAEGVTTADPHIVLPEDNRRLTTLEKLKKSEMEKAAGWWSKYYASKAKLVRIHVQSTGIDCSSRSLEIGATGQAEHGRRPERQLRRVRRVLRR